MKIIAFANQKGGVGKTTSTLSVGAALARKGKRVLIIDGDPQGNLTLSAGIKLSDNDSTLFEVLTGETDINDVIKTGEYDILPADNILSNADLKFSDKPERETLIKKALNNLKTAYDYILIDCPPSLNTITVMALVAANSVIITMQAQYLSMNGIAQLNDTVKLIQKKMNPQLKLGGIIVTQYDHRRVIDREVLEAMKDAFPDKVFDSKIGNNVALAEAPSFGQDIFKYRPSSKAAIQYDALTDEIIKSEV